MPKSAYPEEWQMRNWPPVIVQLEKFAETIKTVQQFSYWLLARDTRDFTVPFGLGTYGRINLGCVSYTRDCTWATVPDSGSLDARSLGVTRFRSFD